MTSRARKLIGWGGAGAVFLAVVVALWLWHFRHYTPAAAMLDLQAAAQTRGARLNTPICGDVSAFHAVKGVASGKNALFFDGRVERTKLK